MLLCHLSWHSWKGKVIKTFLVHFYTYLNQLSHSTAGAFHSSVHQREKLLLTGPSGNLSGYCWGYLLCIQLSYICIHVVPTGLYNGVWWGIHTDNEIVPVFNWVWVHLFECDPTSSHYVVCVTVLKLAKKRSWRNPFNQSNVIRKKSHLCVHHISCLADLST